MTIFFCQTSFRLITNFANHHKKITAKNAGCHAKMEERMVK